MVSGKIVFDVRPGFRPWKGFLGSEREFGTPKGLEQYDREGFPGRVVGMMYDS